MISEIFRGRLLWFAWWLGLLLSALAWFVYVGVYDHPNPVTGCLLLGLGAALAWLGSPPLAISSSRPGRGILIFILLCGAILIRWPFNIGVIFLLFGLVFSKTRASQKLSVPGLALTMQAGVFGVSWWLFARLHDIKYLQYPVIAVLKMLGSDTTFFNNQIILRADGRSIPFVITYDQLGVPLFVVFLVPVLLLRLIGLYKRSMCLKILFGGVIYLFLRYIFLVLMYPFADTTKIFWGTVELLTSFTPLVVILPFIIHMKGEEQLVLRKNALICGGLLTLALACAVFSFTGVDPGVPKDGKILIDEYHSFGWESVTEPLDTKNFGGQRSVYTYYTLVNFLKKFYHVDILLDPKHFDRLEDYDILILKTPTRPFQKQEIVAITKFVENGGGLLLIGDHTNLFGMNDYLNSICKRWGIKFANDATYDLRTGGFTVYSPPPLFVHPVVANVTNYKFATSCSLNVSPFVQSVMIGQGMCSEEVDISHVHFFGNMKSDPGDKWGWFVQCAAKEVRKGRVIAFADSTTFSSFSVLMHDNPEFILGIIEYLNRTNTHNWRWICMALFTSLVFCAGYLIYRRKVHLASLFVVLLLFIPFTIGIANSVYTALVHAYYGKYVIEKLNNLSTIFFDTSHSASVVSHFIGMPLEPSNFSSFFLSFQRLGFWPRETKNLMKSLADGSPQGVVIINPNKPFSRAEKKALETYVRNGGVLLVADSVLNESRTLDDLLGSFGLSSRLGSRTFTISDEQTPSITMFPVRIYYPTSVGRSLSFKEIDGFPTLIAIKSEYFLGKIWLIADSYMISNAVLGDPGNPPTQLQYDLHQKLFSLIDEIFGRAGKEEEG